MSQNIQLQRDDQPLFIMLVGLAGSGKSSISKEIEILNKDDISTKPNRHSSDALREELFGNEKDQEHNNEIFVELHRRIKEDLRNGKDVVYDATNINKKRRVAFLKELKHINCSKICLCVMTPYEMCLKRNKERERAIPDGAIKNMYMHWTPPHTHEGFDQVIPVFNYNDIESKYDIHELFDRIDKIDQENKHHSLTIGEHCREAAEYIKKDKDCDKRLKAATLLHDIGKEFTKTHINSRGENDGQAHYYQHQCVGAYDSVFYLNSSGFSPQEQLDVSNMIYYHMHPYMSWKQSEKARNRDVRMLGEDMFNAIQRLHEADAYAHIPAKEIERDLRNTTEFIEEGEAEIERQ